MSDTYHVRKGTGRGREPRDYDDLISRYRVADDDGKTATAPLEAGPIECLDCGGQLVPAEAGFVPWHRVCAWCGSHWDAGPTGGRLVIRRARFY